MATETSQDTGVEDQEDQLLKIAPYIYGSHVSRGEVRRTISRIFSINGNYTLFSSVVNPEARDLIEEHFAPHDPDLGVHYDTRLKGIYMDVLDTLAKKRRLRQVSYPLVNAAKNTSQEVFWPTVHVVKGDADRFKGLFGQLNDDEAYAILTEREAPHNYNMDSINLLRERRVDPFVLTGRSWQGKGSDLKTIVDFFCQFELTRA